ncbi:leucine-rich repeat domain-containing protein [Chryseobacterium polytrichastri]|nr:hypothetical protein [Chryseobacterium polytrichastri]
MMKNKIFITVILSFTSGIFFSQNLSFKDKNLEKAVIENFDMNKDNAISKFEAEGITNLFLVNKGITLTDDLPFFRNATTILLDDNAIPNASIKSLNKLELFSCTGCKISKFEADNLPKLMSLYLDNNNIENISFRLAPRINQLTISLNKLKTIDLSSLKYLKKLNLEHNQLQKLDISLNKELQTLNLAGNKMKEADVRKGMKTDVTIFGFEE